MKAVRCGPRRARWRCGQGVTSRSLRSLGQVFALRRDPGIRPGGPNSPTMSTRTGTASTRLPLGGGSPAAYTGGEGRQHAREPGQRIGMLLCCSTSIRAA
jgi:hypothetical protein